MPQPGTSFYADAAFSQSSGQAGSSAIYKFKYLEKIKIIAGAEGQFVSIGYDIIDLCDAVLPGQYCSHRQGERIHSGINEDNEGVNMKKEPKQMSLKSRIIISFLCTLIIPTILTIFILSILSRFSSRNLNAVPADAQVWLLEIVLLIALILTVTVFVMCYWIYLGVVGPINVLKHAAKNIQDGNLDVPVRESEGGVREMNELCRTFEEMRLRLKESQEQKIQNDKENRELISNISHDLKTPVTTIKGYVEGILDGVADTPEKQKKYLHTVYNKADDMSRLIEELTLYTRIDTNNIPYNFAKINIADYFADCADELSEELEARGIELTYFNYLSEDDIVIADAEQLKRVINNIIGNSVKYMDKPKGTINIRLRDADDFVQVEFEDNGKGIAQKDLGRIFDRFYRADSSRNSRKGGSGIGLSIVKKIIEDHEGRVWAASKEGVGTTMYFALRKYHEPQAQPADADEDGQKKPKEKNGKLLKEKSTRTREKVGKTKEKTGREKINLLGRKTK